MKAKARVKLTVTMTAGELRSLREALLVAWQQRGETETVPGPLKNLYEALIAVER